MDNNFYYYHYWVLLPESIGIFLLIFNPFVALNYLKAAQSSTFFMKGTYDILRQKRTWHAPLKRRLVVIKSSIRHQNNAFYFGKLGVVCFNRPMKSLNSNGIYPPPFFWNPNTIENLTFFAYFCLFFSYHWYRNCNGHQSHPCSRKAWSDVPSKRRKWCPGLWSWVDCVVSTCAYDAVIHWR